MENTSIARVLLAHSIRIIEVAAGLQLSKSRLAKVKAEDFRFAERQADQIIFETEILPSEKDDQIISRANV